MAKTKRIKKTADKSAPKKVESPLLPIVYDPLENLPEIQKKLPRAASDPLKRYLREIENAPTLTAEEEQKLAKRLHETGDVNLARLLVSANLNTVVRIAFEYRSMYHNLLDLIQEGNIGLMKAVSKFDPSKEVRLGYYASWWIRSYILKYLLDNFRLIRVGTSAAQKKLFYHLMREKERLEAQGIEAGPKLLADRLQVKEKDVVEMQLRLLNPQAEMSLDTPISKNTDGSSKTLESTLVDTNELADEKIEREEWLQLLEEHLPEFKKTLNEKERSVLEARILNDTPATLQEVADQYGLTRERARQIEANVIKKLREHFKNYIA